jgi:hypothetical protein
MAYVTLARQLLEQASLVAAILWLVAHDLVLTTVSTVSPSATHGCVPEQLTKMESA